ncbi:Nrap protein [Neohortaea acidophila]|uniref:U3 small nucleolar RNA-associated protein 22 n=1 Tax=Neohortaea acidophila TaxID=245834 RepID=A0A6A6PRP1_9PEZI|nr:Nrap protein [Neohortaea acidophila]KAF2481887.1 Nrap protein [Neohortaea acidophila]
MSSEQEFVTPRKVPRETGATQKSLSRSARPSQSGASENSAYNSGTFKSNTFKIQVDELLAQIRPRHGARESAAENALHRLKGIIEAIPAGAPLSVDDAERGLLMSSKVVIPFMEPRPPKDAKYKLEYSKPSSINVVGSYALKTASRVEAVAAIDMLVTMPTALFQDKDFLNYRYFYKRAYYLAVIAAALQSACETEYSTRFKYHHDNPFKPIIVVAPNAHKSSSKGKTSSSKWEINILLSTSADVFPPEKLLPDRNCVRNAVDNSSEGGAIATPFYNSSIRSDMLVSSYLKLSHSAAKDCAAFVDACILGNTWLRQRGLGSDIQAGGFGLFEFSAFMALLLSGEGNLRPILGSGYSSYQLLKATLQLLATRDFSKEPLIIGSTSGNVKATGRGAPIVWDGQRQHNLLFKMTPWAYRLLRLEARTTLSMLSDQNFDGFEAAFIMRKDLDLYRYDYVVALSKGLLGPDNASPGQAPLQKYRQLYEVLERALGDRVNLISITAHRSKAWRVDYADPTQRSEGEIRVGFVINPATVHRTVDHGPPAEKKAEAAQFREFWGEKAELRRFKDGSILESLVWSAKESGQSVFEQIVRYAISKHLGERVEKDVQIAGESFARLLSGTASDTNSQGSLEAFRQFETDLRGLDGLPLSIREIVPADAQLRSTSLTSIRNQRQQIPADVVLQFEGSARWPDDLVAIQRTKIAFLLTIHSQLAGSSETATARVGLENGEHDVLNQAFLDVTYDSGASFRLRIHHDREQTLLERRLKDKALDPRTKEVAALGLAKYRRDYVKLPAFTQAIARLCSRYPALSGTIRLLKKWFASHLLDNHVADPVIEMLAARTFVQPWPWQAPSSVQTGFLRTLHWISRWDWRNEPLIVDLSGSGDLKQPEVQSIQTKFEAWRKLDPALNRVVLFCASSVDQDGTAWTDGRPQKVVAARLTALARAACAEVVDKGLDLQPASLFASPLADFDFVIHLNSDFMLNAKSSRKSNGSSAFKNLELDVDTDASRVGYQPLRDFTSEVEALFGAAVLFFSGGEERAVLAGLWQPQTADRAWKLNLGYSTIPRIGSEGEEDVRAEINREGILAEIARIGGDLVKAIEVNRR